MCVSNWWKKLKLIEGEPATRGVMNLPLEPGSISLPGKGRLSTESQQREKELGNGQSMSPFYMLTTV